MAARTPTYSGTGITHLEHATSTGLSPPMADHSRSLRLTHPRYAGQSPYRPHNPRGQWPPVWAPPLSLAATKGLSLDFSSFGYLDVSFPRVSLPKGMTGHDTRRVAPFGNPGIKACVRLPLAYRSLPRPSSPARA